MNKKAGNQCGNSLEISSPDLRVEHDTEIPNKKLGLK